MNSRVSAKYTEREMQRTFSAAANYKQPKCPPIRDWLNKLQYSLTMEYFIDIKNDGVLNALEGYPPFLHVTEGRKQEKSNLIL